MNDRIQQLEDELRKRNIPVPPELTDEERAGAPIPPWKRDWGPGPAINKASWDSMCERYERDIDEWRRSQATYMPMFIDFGNGLEMIERDWTGQLKITKVQEGVGAVADLSGHAQGSDSEEMLPRAR